MKKRTTIDWNWEAVGLGKSSDASIARSLGCDRTCVSKNRIRLGIPSINPRVRYDPEHRITKKMLATMLDVDILRSLKLPSRRIIAKARERLGIPCPEITLHSRCLRCDKRVAHTSKNRAYPRKFCSQYCLKMHWHDRHYSRAPTEKTCVYCEVKFERPCGHAASPRCRDCQALYRRAMSSLKGLMRARGVLASVRSISATRVALAMETQRLHDTIREMRWRKRAHQQE